MVLYKCFLGKRIRVLGEALSVGGLLVILLRVSQTLDGTLLILSNTSLVGFGPKSQFEKKLFVIRWKTLASHIYNARSQGRPVIMHTFDQQIYNPTIIDGWRICNFV